MATSQPTHAVFEVSCDEPFSRDQHQRLYELQQTNSLTDFTIRVGDESISCHKVVLAAVCPYFDSMFRSGLDEAQKGETQFGCFQSHVVKEIVKYCYNGELKVDYDQLKELVDACELLQLKTLKDKLEQHIIKELNVDNCIGWCGLASKYTMERLLETCNNIMRHQFSIVCNSLEFKELPLAEVIDYIKDDEIVVHSEDAKLAACVDWILFHTNRKTLLGDLLNHIDINGCSAYVVDRFSNKHPDIFASDTVTHHLHNMYKSIALSHEVIPTTNVLYLENSDEKALVMFGGQKSSGEWNAKCYLFASSEWTSLTEVPSDFMGKKQPSFCMTNEGVLMSGGKDGDVLSSQCVVFSIHTKLWWKLPDMLYPRAYHGSYSIGRFVYVIGGQIDGEPTTSVEVLCMKVKKWRSLKPMMYSIFCPIVTSIDLQLYIILSKCSENSTIEKDHGIIVLVYDTAKDMWTQVSNVPDAANDTYGSSAIGFDECVYLVGGKGKLCNRYTPKMDTWTILKGPEDVHCYGASLVFNNKIVILGGSSNAFKIQSTQVDTISEYDVENDIWAVAPFKCQNAVRSHFIVSVPVSYIK